MVFRKIWTTTQKFRGCEGLAIILVLGQKIQKTTLHFLNCHTCPDLGQQKNFLACNQVSCLILSMRLKF